MEHIKRDYKVVDARTVHSYFEVYLNIKIGARIGNKSEERYCVACY